ncbi:putative uncharacterized protein [Clostridium sp. CAG:411]|jgi:predicted Holliday junction resolvase-like endonuclease|nr:hypothetical protein [Lachnospiraceae bacterium]CDE45840.1 putative uncharacterized protein [Clostridium sp. CAG:411]
MKWLIILLVVVVILVVACVLLYRKGKQMQEQAESSQEQMRAGSQVQSLLVIDKKKMKLQDANLPKIVMEQSKWYMKRAKVPVVKVKIGPKIVTMLCDEKVYDLIPVKKEVKAVVSGIYIMDIKGARGGVEQKEEKKGFFARFKKK